MGLVRPRAATARAACAWGTHAAAGHRCRGGLKARAPSFGRPGFATGHRFGGRGGRCQ
ncbi:hypothetical protein BLAT2472_50389 [Burkholderia latens]